MKKHGIGSRLLSLLLVLAMVLPMVPLDAFAANVGDIATDTETGDTGLNGNIDTDTTISWPIKIFDYLNDGMLFEYANAGDSGDIADALGGAYGGGTPAPQMNGAAMVIGNDYTIGSTFDEKAFQYIGTYGDNSIYSKNVDNSAEGAFELAYTEVEAKNFVDPGYLNLEYVTDQNGDKTRSYVWISNFARDNKDDDHPNGQYYTGEQVRYAVIVYRTNDKYTAYSGKFFWAVSDGYFGTATDIASDYYYHTVTKSRGGIDITDLSTKTGYGTLQTNYEFTMPKSTDWTYVVVDMKQGDVATYWNNFDTEARVAGIGLCFPLNAVGEEMDISHIAYFDTEFEAIEFGRDAVAFDEDPGEYLNAHTEYTSDGNPHPGTVSVNGWDFTTSGSSSWSDSTIAEWKGTGNYGGFTVTSKGSSPTYLNVTNSDTSRDSAYIWKSSSYATANGTGNGIYADIKYVTVVYRTHNITNPKVGFWLEDGETGAWDSCKTENSDVSITASDTKWVYFTYDLTALDDIESFSNRVDTFNRIGIKFPGFTSSNQSMDIAFVDYFDSEKAANNFGAAGAAYMNNPASSKLTTPKKWNTGNNTAFSMLYGSQGGGWSVVNGNTMGGGANNTSLAPSGYYSYGIGKAAWTGAAATEYNSYRTYAKNTLKYPVSDSIYLLNSWSLIGTGESSYNMSNLNVGYTLLSYLTSGVMTAGLLESSLTTVTANGKTYRVPDYKEDTIEYIAYVLRDALLIPQTDASGNYNYNYVQGTANGDQYGYAGDGTTPLDLASALRKQLGITFSSGSNCGSAKAAVGDYSTMTDADKAALIGKFNEVKGSIETFVDAAYYLLMNLYVDDSYNQAQDEYKYLVLSQATLDNGQTGYVFDGGFTTGIASETKNDAEYRAGSKSATVYDKDLGTISQNSAASKDKVYFSGTTTTTRFPFLPVTDAEGVYASIVSQDGTTKGETVSPYFLDDGRGPMGVTEEGATFVNRNYNFALAANGEFVYHKEDDLFFEFEGDDDVYLFINGVLVLDIGGAHSITNVAMQVNDYVEWAKKVLASPSSYSATDVERANKLNLVEGGTYSFDFYYMERHGWGSNCRIATNIRITDPAMTVEKTAEQYGENVDYGEVVDKNAPIEYNFKLINTGNTKLYNLTFDDSAIGVTLDYTNGLTVANGSTVCDAAGGTLDVTDLSAFVTGYEYVATGGTHNLDENGEYVADPDGNGEYKYNESTVTFADETALLNFLKTLSGNGLVSGDVDDAAPRNGSGLWVDGTVTIQGIYYKLTQDQISKGVFNNTVYVTATTKTDPTASGNETLRSQASHRVYVSSSTEYYQWASHELFLSAAKLLEDATAAAQNEGNELFEAKTFFDYVGKDTSKISFALYTDKDGKNTYTGSDVTYSTTNSGYVINYKTAGTYTIYVKMSLQSTTDVDTDKVKTSAIVPVKIYVTDVKDSVFVLDYGLTTESLDTNGELFKNDALLGDDAETGAVLMGIANTLPSYLSISSSATDYNRINFSALNLNASKTVTPFVENSADADGEYTMRLTIPESGKTITYNAITEQYSLTETGTVAVHANVPAAWTNVYLYYWSDAYTPVSWPGTKMTKDETTGTYSLDIPDNVSYVIISNYDETNGKTTAQTSDLPLTPGVETTYTVTVAADGAVSATRTTAVKNVIVHATVPEGWGNSVYLYYREENSETWQTKQMTADSEGSSEYSVVVPGNVTKMSIGDAAQNCTKQTVELDVYSSRETWINVNKLAYEAEVTYTTPEKVTITATVPEDWNNVYLYYWNGTNTAVPAWPGTAMTKDETTGTYSLNTVPGDMTYVIVNNGEGAAQTLDLSLRAGWNAAITVNQANEDGKYTAGITYAENSSTTVTASVPSDWSDIKLVCYDGAGNTVGDAVSMTKVDNTYSATITNSEIAYVVISGGEGKETSKLAVYGTAMNVTVESLYSALATYANDTHTIHAKVPTDWSGSVNLYCWDNTGAYYVAWPGQEMSKDADGWYSLEIPGDITNVIINTGNNGVQTVDLSVQAGAESWITVNGITKTDDGRDMYLADVEESGITFTPTDFMDDTYSVWMALAVHKVGTSPTELNSAININTEVQMYKKVTVLPATVVYYEDDFPAIEYIHETGTDANTFETIGGSGDYTQGVDQDENYGHDSTYSDGSNTEQSAGTLTTIKINKDGPVAKFTFTGTGFELISRTTAGDYSTIEVAVFTGDVNVTYNSATGEYSQTPYKLIPVINEFDNGGDGGDEAIYQVPVIRVKDMPKNTYTVVISGMADRDWEKDDMPVVPTYLYIDGLRIYQPMGATNVNYNANENGATFAEIRDKIVAGYIASVAYDTDGVFSVSTATTTWTENRNGKDSGYDNTGTSESEYTASVMDSVEDYLILGPNNEVYVDAGDTSKTAALVFYVKEATDGTPNDSVTTHNLQIAVHAVDRGMFYGTGSTGMKAQILYGVKDSNGAYAWKVLTTISDATEQYYTIPYTDCPYDSSTGTYQVAIKVMSVTEDGKTVPAMASFTSLKYNGLEISNIDGDTTTLKYVNGVLYNGNEVADPSKYPRVMQIEQQVQATNVLSNETETVQPESEPNAAFKSASVTLEGEIGLNFYVELSEELLSDANTRVEFTLNGKTQTMYLADAKEKSTGLYVFTCKLAAKNMADEVIAQVYGSNGAVGEPLSYSVRKYCQSFFERTDTDQFAGLLPLLKAMLNYGAYSQIQFGHNTDDLANAILAEEDKVLPESVDLESYKHVLSGNESALQPTGVTLVLESQTAIRVYFTLNDGADLNEIQFTVDGKAVEPVAADDRYYVEVSNIAAKDLDTTYTIQLGGVTLEYSALSYVRSVLSKTSTSDSMKNVTTALYLYNQAANAYFKE